MTIGDGMHPRNQPPAEAQAQGGGEVLAHGWFHRRGPGDDYDLHDESSGAGTDCADCIPCIIVRSEAAPPSAPVGVEGLDLLWLNRALLRLSTAVSDVETQGKAREQAAVVRSLRKALAQQPAAVDGYTTGHCERHKQPGGCDLHNLHCGWPACDRRPAAQSGGSDNDR